LALENVQSTSVRGVLFRHVPAGGNPLFQPEHPADGRWQRGEIVEGFYLAASEQTAWAEWYRALAELAVPPMRQMPRELWRFDVHVEEIADLSSAKELATVGLPSPVPARSQWPRFQMVGEALESAGWPGVLYPSASQAERLEDSHALCLFRHTPEIPGVAPLGPPTRYDEPPAPPSGLRT
jgi:RES domain-containing protein